MVTIEAMSWNCRIGDENHSFGSPYTASCRIDKVSPDTARITILSGLINKGQADKIRESLIDLKFDYVIWERLHNGKYRDVKLSTKRPYDD